MHGRQGCLVACVSMEPSIEQGLETHQTQPDVALKYRTHRTHRTLSPEYESQDIMPLHLRQDSLLLMKKEVRLGKTYLTGEDAHQSPVETVGDLPEHFVTKDSHFTKGTCFGAKRSAL